MEAAGPCQQAPDGQVSTWYQWKRKLMELGREDKNDTGNTGTENWWVRPSPQAESYSKGKKKNLRF